MKKHNSLEYTSVGSVKFMGILSSLPIWILAISLALQIIPAIGTKYTHRAMNGYYCAIAYTSNYTAIGHQRCVARCISDPHCWILAYNSREKYCLLGTQPCVKAVADKDFRMMIFRKHENMHCIQWVWSDGSSYPNHTVEQVSPVHQEVARRAIEGEIYIGRSQPEVGRIVIARKGEVVRYPDYYLLVVAESCSVAWVPYIAGNPLPKAAVEGGHLNSLGTTYCMRVWDDTQQNTDRHVHTYGYYAPSNGLGYYVWYGDKTATQMDILVQVHLFYWPTEGYIDSWIVSNGTKQNVCVSLSLVGV